MKKFIYILIALVIFAVPGFSQTTVNASIEWNEKAELGLMIFGLSQTSFSYWGELGFNFDTEFENTRYMSVGINHWLFWPNHFYVLAGAGVYREVKLTYITPYYVPNYAKTDLSAVAGAILRLDPMRFIFKWNFGLQEPQFGLGVEL